MKNFFFFGFKRNKFIANYYKGMIAFVDEYWKIIHRAAGWDALRYWLLVSKKKFFSCLLNVSFPIWNKAENNFSPAPPPFIYLFWMLLFLLFLLFIQMLLSNRFLTGHDVAQVLLHYEDLVGMAFW